MDQLDIRREQSHGIQIIKTRDRFSVYYKHNKKSLSWKYRHYKNVIEPEALYAEETSALPNKGWRNSLGKKDTNILRKIWWPQLKKEWCAFNLGTNPLPENWAAFSL